MADVKTGVVLAGLFALFGSGCAYGELRQVLRAEFASETKCRDVSIRRRDTWYAYSENFFKVSGCGQLRSYTCPKGEGIVKYGSSGCTWVNGDMDSPQNTKPATDPMTEPMPEEATPPLDEPSSTPTSDDESSSTSSDDDLGSSDLSGDASTEVAPKKAKAKASGGIKLGR